MITDVSKTTRRMRSVLVLDNQITSFTVPSCVLYLFKYEKYVLTEYPQFPKSPHTSPRHEVQKPSLSLSPLQGCQCVYPVSRLRLEE